MGVQVATGVAGAFSSDIRNNIFHFNSDIDNNPIDRNDRFYTSISAAEEDYTLDNNYFYDTGSRSYSNQYPGKRILDITKNSVNEAIGFSNPENMDFTIPSNSGYTELDLTGLLPSSVPQGISMFMKF